MRHCCRVDGGPEPPRGRERGQHVHNEAGEEERRVEGHQGHEDVDEEWRQVCDRNGLVSLQRVLVISTALDYVLSCENVFLLLGNRWPIKYRVYCRGKVLGTRSGMSIQKPIFPQEPETIE